MDGVWTSSRNSCLDSVCGVCAMVRNTKAENEKVGKMSSRYLDVTYPSVAWPEARKHQYITQQVSSRQNEAAAKYSTSIQIFTTNPTSPGMFQKMQELITLCGWDHNTGCCLSGLSCICNHQKKESPSPRNVTRLRRCCPPESYPPERQLSCC